VASLEGPVRLPRRLEVSLRYDDGVPVLRRGPLPRPSVDPALVREAAQALLAGTDYEWDGRGVAFVGVTLHLPPPSNRATDRAGTTSTTAG
jgi:DNA polymerase-4